MKRLGSSAEAWTFGVDEREREFLETVLESFPCVPSDYQPLSREGGDAVAAEDTAMLQEAMMEHQAEGKARVHRWLGDGERFQREREGEGWTFQLAKSDFDWMMQVLNDVRVGNWLRLGAPEDIHNPVEVLRKDPAAFFRMEAAGLFQVQFLEAVQGTDLEG